MSLTRGIVRDARRALLETHHRLPFQDALIAAMAAYRHLRGVAYEREGRQPAGILKSKNQTFGQNLKTSPECI